MAERIKGQSAVGKRFCNGTQHGLSRSIRQHRALGTRVHNSGSLYPKGWCVTGGGDGLPNRIVIKVADFGPQSKLCIEGARVGGQGAPKPGTHRLGTLVVDHGVGENVGRDLGEHGARRDLRISQFEQ